MQRATAVGRHVSQLGQGALHISLHLLVFERCLVEDHFVAALSRLHRRTGLQFDDLLASRSLLVALRLFHCRQLLFVEHNSQPILAAALAFQGLADARLLEDLFSIGRIAILDGQSFVSLCR